MNQQSLNECLISWSGHEVEDQSQTNSCCANAVCGAYEYMGKRNAMEKGAFEALKHPETSWINGIFLSLAYLEYEDERDKCDVLEIVWAF